LSTRTRACGENVQLKNELALAYGEQHRARRRA
jgi:hypothetical protein